MAKVSELLNGYKRFYKYHFLGENRLYEKLATGQSPKTLVIACSDSRVDPAILTDANPGDIFVIRNVANLVPPYQPDNTTYHGTSAALEFAVNGVGVEHIVVLGHSGCAGIQTLVDMDPKADITSAEPFSFVKKWVSIAAKAKENAEHKCNDANKLPSCCEQESIRSSLDNLLTFPWVRQRLEDGTLEIHGWYFTIHDGALHVLDKESNTFNAVPHI